MNNDLPHHGIITELADYRIHVCFVTGELFIFPRASAAQLVQQGVGRESDAFEHGVHTAKGRIIPLSAFKNMRRFDIPVGLLQQHWVKEDDPTPQKGWAAEQLVATMFHFRPFTDRERQTRGMDGQLYGKTVEIKCDYRGGSQRLGGTGNLWLQTHNSNPFNYISHPCDENGNGPLLPRVQ